MASNEKKKFDFENELFGFDEPGDSTNPKKIKKHSGLEDI